MKTLTLDELRAELPCATDEEMNLAISKISEIIQTYIGYDLDLKTEVEYYDQGSVSFVGVQKNISDENSIIITERETGNICEIDYIDGRLIYLKQDSEGGKLKIEYSSGYATTEDVPQNIKTVATSWAISSYNEIKTNQAGNEDLKIKTKKLGSLSLTYFSPKDTSQSSEGRSEPSNSQPSDFAILDTYKIKFLF